MRAVHSFDVFDTVLTRVVGDPAVVLDLVAERLQRSEADPVPSGVLAAGRRRHESRLNRFEARHLSLHEIYSELAASLGLPAARANAWVAAEEEVEREVCVALPGAARMIADSRDAGHQIVFVSDTPHSEMFVADLLRRQGLLGDDDLVFTSSARGYTKARGGLFDAVAAVLGADRAYVHRGDHPRSDRDSARLQGWDGRLVPRGRLTRYERQLEAHSIDTARLSSWLAGSSRLARLEAAERGVAEPVASVASGVMAPFLVGYALWVIAQARHRGVRRLYFVARDGEVMLAVARHVVAAVAPELELRYLHGSRQPWVFGACATSDALLANWSEGRADFTARTTLARMGLGAEQVHGLVGLPAVAPDRADTPLSATERVELAQRLQQEPLVSLVRHAAAASAERTTDYLREVGLTDDIPSALVDAGWSGRAAAGLDQLLIAAGGRAVPHFFVGLLGSPADEEVRKGVEIVPWLFDRQRHPESLIGLHTPHYLVEMFCAGTTGRTVDYAPDADGVVRPVLDRENNEPALAWGVREIQQIAVRVAELVAPRLGVTSERVEVTAAVWENLAAFWEHPTRAEVEAWGTFPGEEEIWPPNMPLAQQITGPGIVRRLWRGETSMRPNNTWRAGSALASNQPWRGLIQARAWREENAARLRRIPRRLRLEVAARRRPR